MISPACPGAIEPILKILDGKWNLLLLRELFNGTKRFGELRRTLHPISPKTLTDRLRMLEENGIVTRTLYPGVPLHVEYELTERGQGLQPIFCRHVGVGSGVCRLSPVRDGRVGARSESGDVTVFRRLI